MELDIDKVAELARLRLKPEERAKLAKDLAGILAYVKQLEAVSVEGVEPTSHVLELENVFREDRVVPQDIREALLAHAARREGPFFKVPKVIEET